MPDTAPQKLLAAISLLPRDKQTLITKSYNFAKAKHRGQKRRSGKPYILHPLRIGLHLIKDGYDPATICSGFLHDTLEDTETTYEELKELFGEEIADIVRGVTKVSSFQIKQKNRIFSDDDIFLTKVDNYRKILVAAVNDPRVIVVKLYDRLDNIETIDFLDQAKQKFYARETIEIFAPLAERLGMGLLKGKLEDISFPYAFPKEYSEFKKTIRGYYKSSESVVERVKPKIKNILTDAKIKVESLSGRTKHQYSLYKKLKRKGSIKQIFDIAALRIVVDSIEDCYKALGFVHANFPPHPGRIHDYIARPKLNGYQSIHTTVKDEDGKLFEVQIRTQEMHRQAEYGQSSHWNYKEMPGKTKSEHKNTLLWLKELEKIRDINDKNELLGQLKSEFFADQIFIFTPKGDIVNLPVESTGIDFAYRIHSELGNHLAGVKINNRITQISTQLKTGDLVEIITNPKASPSRDWLKIAKTAQARQHIRNYLREKQKDFLLSKGVSIINRALHAIHFPTLRKEEYSQKIENSRLPYKTLDKALIALAENNISKIKLIKLLHPDFDNKESVVKKFIVMDGKEIPEELRGIRHSFAGCCNPEKGRELVGYLTKEHVIKIHRKNCKRLVDADERRILPL